MKDYIKTTGDVKGVACYSTARASHARAMDWGGHFVHMSTSRLPGRVPEVDTGLQIRRICIKVSKGRRGVKLAAFL